MRNLVPHYIHAQYKQGNESGHFQATTLFVDISGFTNITETLLHYHRDGAEALTDALKDIFEPLVHEVYRRGGLIPLFAGDAFVAIFPHLLDREERENTDAPFQATQAAFTIQQFFAPERMINTTHGEYSLGIKIGLSTGQVEWGIVGSGDQYSYYFRGEAVNGCVVAQQHAATGEVVADLRVMSLIDDQVTAVPVADTSLYKLTVFSLPIPALSISYPELTYENLAPFVPESVLDLRVDAEFREVCPLFLSFETPTDRTTFHEFAAVIQSLAHQYGGYFSQIDFSDKGGLFVILFGAPITYENELERAAEFLRHLRQQELPLHWRVGMTFGIAWAGIRGGEERCEYGAVGDVVNLAVRLAMKADWGEVWVSADVYERLRTTYWLGELGTMSVKGRQGQILVYQLLQRKELSELTSHDVFDGRLIGRQKELDQLHAYVQPIFSGQCAGVIYIYGDVGAGKSRFVHEFRRQVIGNQFTNSFYCQAEEIIRTSLNPFKKFLREHFRQFALLDNEKNRANFDAVFDFLVQQLSDTEPESKQIKQELLRTRSILAAMIDLHWEGSLYEQLEPKLRFENMLAAFKNFIKAEAMLRPVVIHIEDGQWLDPDSLQMVNVLTRNITTYPVAIIFACRYLDDGQKLTLDLNPDVPVHEIVLDDLSEQETQALAEQVLQGTVGDEVVRPLYEKTGGNPFFVEQMVLDLYERNVLEVTSTLDMPHYSLPPSFDEDVPPNVNAILISRLDRLAPGVKQVVQTAATLGQEFDARVLTHMLPTMPELSAKIEMAEKRQIWLATTESRYAFKNALLRDVAYSMQLRARLRILHQVAARAIEQAYATDLEPHYADLAYHYHKAESYKQATKWYKLAGQQAAERYANADSLTYLGDALKLVAEEDYAAQFELYLIREKIYALQGKREAQKQDLETLASLADFLSDDQKQVEVALLQSHYAFTTGDYLEAGRLAETAVHLAQNASHEQGEAAGYLVWGQALLRQAEYATAQQQFRQAIDLAQTASLQKVKADSLRFLGTLLLELGDYAESQAYYEQAMSIFQDIEDKRGLGMVLDNLGSNVWEQGDYPSAHDYREKALHIFQEIGDREGEARALNNLGGLYMDQGDYEAALHRYEEVLQICREIDVRRGEYYALLNLGLLHYYQNQFENALDYSQQALQVAHEMGGRPLHGYAFTNIGRAFTGAKQPAQAAAAYHSALAIWQELSQNNLVMEAYSELARVAHMQGDLTGAKALVEKILDYLEAGNSLDGTESPFRIYLICYHILRVTQDARARDTLTAGYDLLQERAAFITDEVTRHSFLHNIAVHAELVREFTVVTTEEREDGISLR